ncbi:FAD-binding oxidoreductase [bacterium]|nr:MAG: FAD-binding oxidoreductase [bacterium]
MPQGVQFPKSYEEIVALVKWCAEHGVSITARAAGTSLAGQTTGGGIVMDTSRFLTNIQSVNLENKTARVQSGVIRDTLNRELAPFDLLYGPDTSTTNRCMIGGMIGNNSSGSYTIKYGSVRDQIHSIDVILSDGSEVTFGPLSDDELEAKTRLNTFEGHIYRETLALLKEHGDAIKRDFPHPDIVKRNTGYAIDKLLEMSPLTPGGRPFNMAELLCGSEGTLAITKEAVLKLSDKPKRSILIVPQFANLRDSLVSTVYAVEQNPAAVELLDKIVLDATLLNIEQSKNRFFLEGDPAALLIIQLDGESVEELLPKAEKIIEGMKAKGLGYAYPILTDLDEIRRVWDLRKAGLGLLMGLGYEQKSPTFVEDTAVRVQDLPDYIDEFQAILDRYDSSCVFYAHASVGLLHIRPQMDIRNPEGIEAMKKMVLEVAHLIKKYRGSLSGEHGDGRVRAPYIELVLSKEMIPVLEKVKDIWDPKGILNPGKIVRAKPMEADMRFGEQYQIPNVETVFNWRKEGTFADAIELCNGAGVCRKLALSGGTMCPSYMATKEEKNTTRGRSNAFRQLFSGKQKDAFSSEELKDALDLCLSCKACKSECPASVDMAKMKAEFTHGYHQANGVSFSHFFFGNPGLFYPMAQLTPRIANWTTSLPVVKELFKQLANVSPKRSLPKFELTPFSRWVKEHRNNGAVKSTKKVFLMVDLYVNHHETELGKNAVKVLETLGYEVIFSNPMESGRTQISKGLLDKAKKVVQRNIVQLYEMASQNIPILGLEPSEILTLRDEYLDLCDAELLDKAKVVASKTRFFDEFIAEQAAENPDLFKKIFAQKGEEVLLHGHCHQKALIGTQSTINSLKAAGYKPTELPTGCCGMAGSFGYEDDHFETSMQVGELVLFPKLRAAKKDVLVCAPGFSCRHQIKDGVDKEAQHTASLLARALR